MNCRENAIGVTSASIKCGMPLGEISLPGDLGKALVMYFFFDKIDFVSFIFWYRGDLNGGTAC